MDKSTGPSAAFPSVVAMTTRRALRISSAGIEGLGHDLADIADYLQVAAHYTRDGSQESYGFPTASGWGAMDSVLGDYELRRVALCADLRRLRDLARHAGGCYVVAESANTARNRGIR